MRRINVEDDSLRNPLGLGGNSAEIGRMKAKIRRLLNFLGDQCITKKEYEIWASKGKKKFGWQNKDELRAEAKKLGKKLEERAFKWVNEENSRVKERDEQEGEVVSYFNNCPFEKFNTGKLISRIDGFKGEEGDEFKRRLLEDTDQIVNKKRSDEEEGVETIE